MLLPGALPVPQPAREGSRWGSRDAEAVCPRLRRLSPAPVALTRRGDAGQVPEPRRVPAASGLAGTAGSSVPVPVRGAGPCCAGTRGRAGAWGGAVQCRYAGRGRAVAGAWGGAAP